MPLTTEEALARRDELLAQEAELQERIDEIQAERERVRQREEPPPPEWMTPAQRRASTPVIPGLSASNAALALARIDAVRGVDGAAAEVERLEAHIADVEQRLQDGIEGERVLREAIIAAQADLERLYVDEFDAFAAYAERFTQVASEKLMALHAPWAEAVDAWNAAAAAWQPLVSPNGLRSVERCPLPSPEAVFGAVERSVPEGTPIVFEPVDPGDDRSPVTVAAGDPVHDALRTDPAWRARGVQAEGAVPAARPVGVEPVASEVAAA